MAQKYDSKLICTKERNMPPIDSYPLLSPKILITPLLWFPIALKKWKA